MNTEMAHAEIATRVRAARSSFYWPMMLQSKPHRQGLFALYAYSHTLDDIADGNLSKADKLLALNNWRLVVERIFATDSSEDMLNTPLAIALSDTITRFNLPKASLIALIEGMEADVNGPIVAPSWAELTAYADQVATAVGLLCLQIWGWRGPDATAFAHATGQALQLTNILRDVSEDARNGRLYVPEETLQAAAIMQRTPLEVINHTNFPAACTHIADHTQNYFTTAKQLWSDQAPKTARPAWAMLRSYEALFKKIHRTGVGTLGSRISLSRLQKVTTLCHAYLTAR